MRLLGKPSIDWLGVEPLDADSGDVEWHLALKAIARRRQRNDLVRRREFDMLRALRQQKVLSAADGRHGPPPSACADTASTHAGERARTIRKIDEIETQMVNAWFKRRPSPRADQGVANSPQPPPKA